MLITLQRAAGPGVSRSQLSPGELGPSKGLDPVGSALRGHHRRGWGCCQTY